jgi:hypothetical protein
LYFHWIAPEGTLLPKGSFRKPFCYLLNEQVKQMIPHRYLLIVDEKMPRTKYGIRTLYKNPQSMQKKAYIKKPVDQNTNRQNLHLKGELLLMKTKKLYWR